MHPDTVTAYSTTSYDCILSSQDLCRAHYRLLSQEKQGVDREIGRGVMVGSAGTWCNEMNEGLSSERVVVAMIFYLSLSLYRVSGCRLIFARSFVGAETGASRLADHIQHAQTFPQNKIPKYHGAD
jgi:hypothetical protein